MKDLSKYCGIIPAFYACYDEGGEISAEGTKLLANHLYEEGVKGLYVGGSSGECIYHSVEDRMKVLENVCEAVGDKMTIIAHVACNNTKDSALLAKHAQDLGVDAIASIPPIYFKLPEYAIAKYWNDISEAAPDTDFVIYNIPQLAGVALTMPLLKTMLANPRVIAVKNSSMPTQDIQMFKDEAARAGKDFVVFNGPDEQLVAGLSIGADGGIGGTYAAMPALYLKIFEIVKSNGDMAKAQAIQNDANRIIYRMCEAKGNLYAVMKTVIKKRHGLELGGVRAPLYPMAEGDMAIANEAVTMIDEAISRL